jgi:hypothetical protein
MDPMAGRRDSSSKGDSMACPECYSDDPRVTPILDPESCLMTHAQYICSACGRAICAEADSQNKYRIKYPFKSLEIAKLYLRAAEAIYGGPCEIYEVEYSNGRTLYKIFHTADDMEAYLKKNPMQSCPSGKPLFTTPSYKPHDKSQVRKMSTGEIAKYLEEKRG